MLAAGVAWVDLGPATRVRQDCRCPGLVVSAAGSCGVSGTPTRVGQGLDLNLWVRNSMCPEKPAFGVEVNVVSEELHAGDWSRAAVTASQLLESEWNVLVTLEGVCVSMCVYLWDSIQLHYWLNLQRGKCQLRPLPGRRPGVPGQQRGSQAPVLLKAAATYNIPQQFLVYRRRMQCLGIFKVIFLLLSKYPWTDICVKN